MIATPRWTPEFLRVPAYARSLPSRAQLVYGYYCAMWVQGMEVFPSIETLAEYFGVDEKTIRRANRELGKRTPAGSDKPFIIIKKRVTGNGWNKNLYILPNEQRKGQKRPSKRTPSEARGVQRTPVRVRTSVPSEHTVAVKSLNWTKVSPPQREVVPLEEYDREGPNLPEAETYPFDTLPKSTRDFLDSMPDEDFERTLRPA